MNSSSQNKMKGYLRQDGRKGIRNLVVVAYLVECAHHVSREIIMHFHGQPVHLNREVQVCVRDSKNAARSDMADLNGFRVHALGVKNQAQLHIKEVLAVFVVDQNRAHKLTLQVLGDELNAFIGIDDDSRSLVLHISPLFRWSLRHSWSRIR